jgi:hypothetical protein
MNQGSPHKIVAHSKKQLLIIQIHLFQEHLNGFYTYIYNKPYTPIVSVLLILYICNLKI